MNNVVVNQLLDVDKEARRILDEAQQYYDNTMLELADEKTKMISDYERKAKAHLEEIGEAEKNNITLAETQISERYKNLSLELDKTFLENHANWEDELFAKCIGR